MTLTRAEGATTLTGHVRDRELQGLLQRVSDLGLTLLETAGGLAALTTPARHLIVPSGSPERVGVLPPYLQGDPDV